MITASNLIYKHHVLNTGLDEIGIGVHFIGYLMDILDAVDERHNLASGQILQRCERREVRGQNGYIKVVNCRTLVAICRNDFQE